MSLSALIVFRVPVEGGRGRLVPQDRNATLVEPRLAPRLSKSRVPPGEGELLRLVFPLCDLQIEGRPFTIDENDARVQQLLSGAVIICEASHHAIRQEEFDRLA